jgi:hypothetical protein
LKFLCFFSYLQVQAMCFCVFCLWSKHPPPQPLIYFFSINDLFREKCFRECSLANVLKPMWFNEL